MHQYHGLRVFRQQHRLGIEWIHRGIGVLFDKCFTSFSIHSSCSLPRLPSPPAFKFITYTSPMKCTPFLSKLYHPDPCVPLP